MHWFGASERGLALGVRQTSVPIAGFWVALTLPALVSGNDPRDALLAVAAVCLAGALGGLLVLRGGDHVHDAVARPAPMRDRGIWVLSGGSALILAPQVCLVGFLVVFLHGERGLSTAEAGAVLAAVNALGIATRIGAGHWSDVVGSRLAPLRLIALALTVLVAATAAVLGAPLWLLLPLLVVTGCVAISWNGLAFTAVAEAAGPGAERHGARAAADAARRLRRDPAGRLRRARGGDIVAVGHRTHRCAAARRLGHAPWPLRLASPLE